MSAPRMPESLVAWIWEQRKTAGRLVTQDGRLVQVIYPGRRSGSWGPDFHGALLAFDGAIVRGDVEVHVHARDWHVHGHGSDPAYANTVLHVVLAAEAALPTVRHDGVTVPTLALEPALSTPMEMLLAEMGQPSAEPEPCRDPEEAAAVLERAGMARFAAKAARFEGDFTVVNPPQALWTGLFEALGYSANVQPFRRLSDRVPLAEARLAAAEGPVAVLALLLGEAGLLPHQRGRFTFDPYGEELEKRWRSTDRYGPIAPLGWRIVGVRPANGPARRVAAAATLFANDREMPLHQRVLAAVSELPPERAPGALRSMILCTGDAYWREHGDFGRPLGRATNLIGPDRARDVVVNVLLPWAAAVGRSRGEEVLVSSAEAVYRTHPRLAANEITRHMALQIAGAHARLAVRTACHQQGLIHLYRAWCDARDCAGCPAGPPLWGSGARGRGTDDGHVFRSGTTC